MRALTARPPAAAAAPRAGAARAPVCAALPRAAPAHRLTPPSASSSFTRRARRPAPRAPRAEAAPTPASVPAGCVAVVLLAGGSGKRMGAPIPKQYLDLCGRPIAAHSLATFAAMPEVGAIVIVCGDDYRPLFETQYAALPSPKPPLAWAAPGAERQDSVASGLAVVPPACAVVAVHDSARPLVAAADVRRCVADALAVGAAVLAVPVKPTIKEVGDDGRVVRTLERARLWEAQTPQCVRVDLLKRGFAHVAATGAAVTDDVSVVEALGEPVAVTLGAYTNIKVTTPDDMSVAERFLTEAQAAAVAA